MTNSIFDGNVNILMLVQKLMNGLKKEKRARAKKADVVTEQVKEMLQTENQKLILMVRN